MREQIQALSARLGADPMLVQGAGGNISWKEDGRLWVKASGACMRDSLGQDLFVPVDLASTRDLSRPVRIDPDWQGTTVLRPSIETTLHALMPQTVVVHLHSVELLAHLVCKTANVSLSQLLEDPRHALVPYCKPGVDLSSVVQTVIGNRPGIDVLLLANHGIVVAAADCAGVEQRIDEVLRSASTKERPAPRIDPGSAPPGYHCAVDPRIHDLAFDASTFDIARRSWALTPDHVVFLGPNSNTFTSHPSPEKLQEPRDFLIVRGEGVFVADAARSSSALTEEMLRCFRDVVMRVPDAESICTLSAQDIQDLLGWEAERYRRALNTGELR